jgi:hypothetical protein
MLRKEKESCLKKEISAKQAKGRRRRVGNNAVVYKSIAQTHNSEVKQKSAMNGHLW